MKERSVVRRIRSAAMPSTPSEYFAPREGIQSCVSRKKKSPDLRKPAKVQSWSESRNSAPAKSVVTHRTIEAFSRGTKSTTSVPTTGRKMRSERSPFIRRPSLQEEIEAHEAEDAEGHRQRIVLGTAGLDAVHPAERGLEDVSHAVHGAIHERAVEPRGDVREPEREAAGAVRDEVDDPGVNLPEEPPALLDEAVHEDGLVEFVHTVLIAHEAVEAAEGGRDPLRHGERVSAGRERNGQEDSKKGDNDRRDHQAELGGVGDLVQMRLPSGCQRSDDRLQEPFEEILFPEDEIRDPEPPHDARARREDPERNRHRRGRLVDVLELLRRPAERPVKRHLDEPEHVEGREPRREDREGPEDLVAGAPLLREDRVLREEAREAREARDRERCDEHRDERVWDQLAKPRHLRHVLLASQRVDHGARSEEEAGLEPGVREDVEHASREGERAAAEEHVAEL